MNLYIRYFENEVLVESLEEACDFLSSIPEIDFDDYLANDLARFYESDQSYPKRYKVHSKAYFIVIKTTAKNLQEFKEAGSAAQDGARRSDEKARLQDTLNEVKIGWYKVDMLFKRVVAIPETQKFQYIDTPFEVQLKAISLQDCYNRVIDHLRSRGDVDSRSQFPSIKGKNYISTYLGLNPE